MNESQPDEVTSAFASPPEALLEKHLRDFLSSHLSEAFGHQLELLGTEFSTDVGRIDILARHSSGPIWVIELKNQTGTREAVGQLLSYVGAIKRMYPLNLVRGFLIAPEFDKTALSALEITSDILFFTFKVRYTLNEKSRSPNLRGNIEKQLEAEWTIDVDKEVIFHKSNRQEIVSLSATSVIPGLGVSFSDLFVPYSSIQLIGDGDVVSDFERRFVNGKVPNFQFRGNSSTKKGRKN